MKIQTNITPARRLIAALRFRRCMKDLEQGLLPQPRNAQPASVAVPQNVPTVTKLAVSRPEAAKLLSVSLRTFDRWVASGLIHASGVGRRKIFAVTELRRFLDESGTAIEL